VAPGVALEFKVTDNWYVNAVAANGEGRTGTTGLDTLSDGNVYGAVEVGYKVGKEGEPQGNYRLTGWHNDSDAGSGYGASIGFDQEVGGG
jgi:hypothetical protein